MNFIFIADFFASQVLGGGELNNDEFIKLLKDSDHDVISINSHAVTPEFIEQNKKKNFIVANFINLRPNCISALYDKNYVIYEHDHKYLTTRDPGQFKDFLAPKDAIINNDFYAKAKSVFCQSQFHLDIIYKNLKINNLVSLAGNLWSTQSLQLMEGISEIQKKDTYAIMLSSTKHKNTHDAIKYCEHKKFNYELIKNDSYEGFLKQLGAHKTLVFFPKTPETLSRIVVEARMMGLGVITNNKVGAIYEDWYNLKGASLVKKMQTKRLDIPKQVIEGFHK
jgi:hypothetical protein